MYGLSHLRHSQANAMKWHGYLALGCMLQLLLLGFKWADMFPGEYLWAIMAPYALLIWMLWWSAWK